MTITKGQCPAFKKFYIKKTILYVMISLMIDGNIIVVCYPGQGEWHQPCYECQVVWGRLLVVLVFIMTNI